MSYLWKSSKIATWLKELFYSLGGLGFQLDDHQTLFLVVIGPKRKRRSTFKFFMKIMGYPLRKNSNMAT